MSFAYEKVPDVGAGLRLHLNENTAGCSSKVLEAMRQVSRLEAAFYPDYSETRRACAAWIGVPPECVALTNGLDEGIHATAFGWLPRGADGMPRDAVVIEPAFDMYAACADAAGGRVVQVMPREDFVFPSDLVHAAITPRTGVVYVTSPNNPTGLPVPLDAIRTLAGALPPGAVMFLDEAYIEFGGESFVEHLPSHPNVIVGRTFAKAHGLAAVRAGVVVAAAPVIARLERILPPYGVNVFAAAAIRAAIADQEYVNGYVRQVRESRDLIYDFCRRLGLHCWPSAANFVLVRVGERASSTVARLAARGVFIRDRSKAPGCAGCVRITAGVVEHTRACLAALEEELCAAE